MQLDRSGLTAGRVRFFASVERLTIDPIVAGVERLASPVRKGNVQAGP